MNKNQAQQKYLRKVRSYLPCSRKVKNQLMAQIADSVGSYLTEEPEATYEQIVARFGNPETIAAAYVESTGTAEILRALQIRRRIVAIVAAVMAVILLSWAIVVTWTAINYNNSRPGNPVVTIRDGQPRAGDDLN